MNLISSLVAVLYLMVSLPLSMFDTSEHVGVEQGRNPSITVGEQMGSELGYSPINALPSRIERDFNVASVGEGCVLAGCSNELCVDQEEEIFRGISACGSSPTEVCKVYTTCEKQSDGKCDWTPSDDYGVCLNGVGHPVKQMKVIEVRYFPAGEAAAPYHPDDLSEGLVDYLRSASTFKGYKGNDSVPGVDVEVVDVININGVRPNPDGTWYSSYAQTLADNNLCSRINSEGIDQVWMWVDPTMDNAVQGWEFVISSNFFRTGVLGAITAPLPFCGGEKSFMFMGFDFTRTPDLALHSYGHLAEAIIRTLQGEFLFWNDFGKYGSSGASCGNVHFPPNGRWDYDYSNLAYVHTDCENWTAGRESASSYINCSEWGCSQGGYLTWWFQNMVNSRELQTHGGKYLPNWWEFLIDVDRAILKYYPDSKYHLNRSYLDSNENPTCSCSGSDQFGNPVYTNQCGFSVVGMDLKCYQCQPGNWMVVGDSQCN